MMKPKVLGGLAALLVVLAILSWATSRTKYSTASGGGFDAVLGANVDTGVPGGKFLPRADVPYPVSRNKNRAVVDGRLGDRYHHTGAEQK